MLSVVCMHQLVTWHQWAEKAMQQSRYTARLSSVHIQVCIVSSIGTCFRDNAELFLVIWYMFKIQQSSVHCGSNSGSEQHTSMSCLAMRVLAMSFWGKNTADTVLHIVSYATRHAC